ncbi:hypothetical protein BST97_06825 [Nonlabens spongiae]|uniref:Peptidase S8 n=1 Tax=Nonlabens spongiae TaxID=331648 RepID=A0A1W6MJH0_9FLAO|nr:S8 family serine peptidase [Nonlabens spongiae]ARN77733.1 hypothetical protein BST97_06825 [Nonlabens spongiae]
MKLKYLIAGLLLTASTASVLGQSEAQRKYISNNTNSKFQDLARQELNRYNEERLARIDAYLQVNNVPVKYRDEKGNLVVLEDVTQSGDPKYVSIYNLPGVRTIEAQKLYPGGSLGVNATGNGIVVGIWDGGDVRSTHTDLLSRVTLLEFSRILDNHATHVGGTIIGDGTTTSSRRGVAYEGTLRSYDLQDDTGEIRPEAEAGMILSNHSYGLVLQNNLVYLTGKYDSDARGFDIITYFNPFFLPVVAAGNDRGDGFNTSDSGYDLITDKAIAKNVITVGAVEQELNYTNPSDVTMSTFSSWGPADDGRIKPDIVAVGVNVTSPIATSDTAYGTLNGTSMATPMVSGGIALLHDLYDDLNPSQVLRSASMKGLVLSSTKEAGNAAGPDYRFGWGLMDVEAAAQVLLNEGSSTLIQEEELTSGATFTRNVVSNQSKLKVALSWTDPFGNTNSAPEDDPTPALVNDLDIKLTDSNGVDFFPWKLNVNNFTAAATKGVNDVDNIEIVEIDAPAGSYSITVDHKGSSLRFGSQEFSLIIQGADPGTLSTSTDTLETVKIYPNPANNFVNVAMNGQLSGSKINITIHDILAKQVLNRSFDNSSVFQQRIDISTLKSGVYLMNVSDGSASTTKKLIVK